MQRFFEKLTSADWGWFAALIVLMGCAIWGIQRLQATIKKQPEPTAGDMLTEFRDLHGQGDLSDEEYAAIRSKLAPDLKQQASQTESAS